MEEKYLHEKKEHDLKVEKHKNESEDRDSLKKMANLFKVIADETRVRILNILQKDELSVCCIADILDMTQSAISHQLKVLRMANLVTNRREGKTIYYRLADSHVETLFAEALDHVNE